MKNRNEPELLQVGDVFKSKSLIAARHHFDTETMKVVKNKIDIKGTSRMSWFNRWKTEDGVSHMKEECVNIGGVDDSRGDAEFVVTATAYSGGGSGHGFNDTYPNGHEVTAKRLSQEGQYDPDGEEVSFYQTGSFCQMLEDVEKTRTMRMSFQ